MLAFALGIAYYGQMADTLKAPPGKQFVQTKTGAWELQDRPYVEEDTRTISFRIPKDEYARLWSFTETFEKRQWGIAMRWLLEQPEVIEVMKKRRSSVTRRRPKR